MYTGLRGSVTFKKGVAELVDEWWQYYACEYSNLWHFLNAKGWKYVPEFYVFADDVRSSYIPFGAVCYMPDDWEEHDSAMLDGATLMFTCSLKNYTGTIQKFIECLPHIADSWDLESRYEEGESVFYKKEME